jgi:hypothetical protein
MGVTNAEVQRARLADALVVVVVLGSLWGLVEVVLGGAIRLVGLPYRAGILTGVGLGILGISVGAFRKPWMLAGIALVTVLCKQLVVPILHVSVMCQANSCLAVILEGIALAGVMSLAEHKLNGSYAARIVSGGSAALLAAATFYFAGMRLAPCRYLLSFNRPGGFVSFLTAEGLVWAVFAALLFPVGYWVGTRLQDTALAWRTKNPSLYYTASASLVACCWVASGVGIAVGL